jgi:Xaa-Pro aminopeptidase
VRYNSPMRFSPLPATFHAKNRDALAKAIGDEAIAIIDTADELTRPGDYEYPFRPDSNFYYLTGITEPEAVLVLVPGQANKAARELLFTSGTSEFVGQWVGERLTPEAAASTSGVANVMPLSDLDFVLGRLLEQYHTVYLNAEESLTSVMPHPAKRRANTLRERAPLHQLRSALPLLGRQRAVKDPLEVAQIQQAVDITAAAMKAAWAKATPGAFEYAAEAELLAEFTRSGATMAWPPIVASGPRTTVIHYSANSAKIAANDLVLIDTGAEFSYYAADISRTFPASGRFTKRQREVYEAVYRIQQAGLKLHKPGASVLDIDTAMRELYHDELKKLGIKAEKHLRPYYPHISHHLGLDIHDTGGPRLTFVPGMVVTCEPGLYIKEEGIGVRIEDDILITKDGYEHLSKAIPANPDDIEATLAGLRQ